MSNRHKETDQNKNVDCDLNTKDKEIVNPLSGTFQLNNCLWLTTDKHFEPLIYQLERALEVFTSKWNKWLILSVKIWQKISDYGSLRDLRYLCV